MVGHPRYVQTLAFRLHVIAALAVAAVVTLTAVSVHFSHRTKSAVAVLMSDGIKGSSLAAQLGLLLQQHRNIVESAPAQVDRNRMIQARLSLQELNEELVATIDRSMAGTPGGASLIAGLTGQVGDELPRLTREGDQVLALAYGFAQDKALEASQGPYASAANGIQRRVSEWQKRQEDILSQQAAAITDRAEALSSYVLGCAAAVLLFAAIAAVLTRRVLHRLERLKVAMLRLADHDTAVPIPSLTSNDEIGAVAQAVQSFKENAIRVLAQEADLQQAAARLEAALGNMSQGLCLYDGQKRLQVFNRRFSEIFGLDHSKLRLGMPFHDVVQLGIDVGNHPGQTADDIVARRTAEREAGQTQIVLQGLAGGRVVAISHCLMEGGGWVSTYEDVTARQMAEQRIAFMARHDALTSLPNRTAFNERLEQALAELRRGAGSAVLCLDLDRFKAVNDTLGHSVGDALLQAVAGRLLAVVRAGDMVARLGGDEFAVVQANVACPQDARQLADRIVAAVGLPYEIDGHHLGVGISVGIALAPEDGTAPDMLMRNADMALYRAKTDGRGSFCFFEPGMDARQQSRRQLEFDLRGALAREEFELFYQPLIDLDAGVVAGFEALLRWHHPQDGLVLPGEFVPILEDIGLITPVGEWVIRRACADAAAWPDGIRVAVNLSPVQFKSPNLAQVVGQALATSGLAAQRLELEITESVLLLNNTATLAMLHDLRNLGVRIAMDDFGTGYSSLSYLRSFPFDRVKLDQSFIGDLSAREDSVHVVRAMTGLCAGLGMAITAEGVETPEQLAKLRLEGCTEVQGFLFSPPKPSSQVLDIIGHLRQTMLRRAGCNGGGSATIA